MCRIYQPFIAEIDLAGTAPFIQLAVTNRNLFVDLSHLRAAWALVVDGTIVLQGNLTVASVRPQQVREFRVPVNAQDVCSTRAIFTCTLDISFLRVRASQSLPVAHEEGWEQFELPWRRSPETKHPLEPEPISSSSPSLVHDEAGSALRVSGDGFAAIFNKSNGRLQAWVVGGEELLHEPVAPSFWRPPTDNDLGADHGWSRYKSHEREWLSFQRSPVLLQKAAMERRTDSIRWCSELVVAASTSTEPHTGPRFRCCYTVMVAGIIIVEAELLPVAAPMPDLPRFGMQFALRDSFEDVGWLGRGPHENYWDRKMGARIGQFHSSILNQTVPYIRPQENGYKEDVCFAYIMPRGPSRGYRRSVLILGETTFGFSAHHFSDSDFGVGGGYQRHTSDLRPRPQTWLHVDYRQQGVGGIDSWGFNPSPLSKYSLPYAPLHLTFTLSTFDSNQLNPKSWAADVKRYLNKRA